MTLEELEASRRRLNKFAEVVGRILVDAFHQLALFAIGATVVWSAAYTFFGMTSKGHATLDDILLLFIYLELGAMVGIYFKTNRMPVRFLIYIAMTALTRMLISDVQATHNRPDWGIVLIAGAILLLAIATLIVRYGSARFPSPSTTDTA